MTMTSEEIEALVLKLTDLRTGLGYDIHSLEPGEGVTLGGVHIACPWSLVGHSDADVLIHAVMDAILGALGLPDIGYWFPPTDEQYRGVSSIVLLEKVVSEHLSPSNYTCCNIDCVLVAQHPKVLPHVESMKANLGRALSLESSRIGVKATTKEGLGAVGRGEGIEAYASVLLRNKG